MKKIQLLQLIVIALAGLSLAASPLYAAPKKDRGPKDKGPKVHKEHPVKPDHIRGKAKGLKKGVSKALYHNEKASLHRTEKVSEKDKVRDNRVLLNNRGHNKHSFDASVSGDIDHALKKLENARWSYNPLDDRGQGNMSVWEMLSPFGHDKDSDRKELYGNNGRVVFEPLPEPEPDPDDGTDDGSTDDGSTDDGSTDDGSTDDGSTDDGGTDDGSDEDPIPEMPF